MKRIGKNDLYNQESLPVVAIERNAMNTNISSRV